MRQISKSQLKQVQDDVTYFFLITHTDKGATLSAAQRRKNESGVNSLVKKEGGQCRLYATTGAVCDFISVISGISPAAAIRIAAGIENGGAVKATLVSGLECFS